MPLAPSAGKWAWYARPFGYSLHLHFSSLLVCLPVLSRPVLLRKPALWRVPGDPPQQHDDQLNALAARNTTLVPHRALWGARQNPAGSPTAAREAEGAAGRRGRRRASGAAANAGREGRQATSKATRQSIAVDTLLQVSTRSVSYTRRARAWRARARREQRTGTGTTRRTGRVAPAPCQPKQHERPKLARRKKALVGLRLGCARKDLGMRCREHGARPCCTTIGAAPPRRRGGHTNRASRCRRSVGVWPPHLSVRAC
jgi:hypothetical protein